MRATSILALCTLVLAGCATGARIDQMASAPKTLTQAVDPALRHAINVSEVTGGRETNPMWTSQVSSDAFRRALEESLQNAGIYERVLSHSRYRLIADITRVDQPLMGLDMTVASSVRYSLIETSTNKEVYNRVIAVSYTAKLSDALIGSERLRLANEGAMRVNIEKLVEDLLALKPR